MASDDLKLLIHTASAPADAARTAAKPRAAVRRRSRRLRINARLSFQERLLRNSFLACAVLLGILALGNIQQPWAIRASEGIEQALTMKVDLDQSLGQLSFVKNIMPESALVFFNLSGDHELHAPVQGNLTHAYSDSQPWLMFECTEGAPVCAAAAGTISAVSELSDGTYGVLIDHGDGMESVTANLTSVELQSGDQVLRGGTIGTSSGSVYFELRQGGETCDPTPRMGL